MTSESLRVVRDRFSEFVERVPGHHERVAVTRNGSLAAVLMSPEDLESLEETLTILGDSDALRELAEAQSQSPPLDGTPRGGGGFAGSGGVGGGETDVDNPGRTGPVAVAGAATARRRGPERSGDPSRRWR